MDAPEEIRPLRPDELELAAQITAAEGWTSQDRGQLSGYYEYAPEGFLIAFSGGRPVGILVATPYGACGYLGDLIVVPEARGRGLGRRLLERGMATLRASGAQSLYLDAAPLALSLYERAGFRRVCPTLRFNLVYQSAAPVEDPPGVRAMQSADLAGVLALDRAAFGVDRGFFLRRRFAADPQFCLVQEQDGEIGGFILARDEGPLVSAGPWIVMPGVHHPEGLMQALAARVARERGVPIKTGVLQCNAAAVGAVHRLGFRERAEPLWRMVLGPSAGLGESEACYSIGSSAKG